MWVHSKVDPRQGIGVKSFIWQASPKKQRWESEEKAGKQKNNRKAITEQVSPGDPGKTAEHGQPGVKGCSIHPVILGTSRGAEKVSVKSRKRQTFEVRKHHTKGMAPEAAGGPVVGPGDPMEGC